MSQELEVTSSPAQIPHFHGHRDRLREKLIESEGAGLKDYELVELLLFCTIPRRDVKPLAKELLAHFGDLWSLLHAAPSVLKAKFKLSLTTIALFKTSAALVLKLQKHELGSRPLLSSWDKLITYCTGIMGHLKIEEFRLLFLDHKFNLIADELQHKGTVNQTAVYPREVIKRSLELGASGLILVHNHPSGDITPSRQDIDMTKQICEAGKLMNIKIHDHVIIGKGDHTSFKTLGLL